MPYIPAHRARRDRSNGQRATPLLIAAALAGGSAATAHLQTREAQAADAQAASPRVAALLAERAQVATVSASRAAHRLALAKPLTSASRYANVDPARTPQLPESLLQVSGADTRATVKLRTRLAEAIQEMRLTEEAYARAAATASSRSRAVVGAQHASLSLRDYRAASRDLPSDDQVLAARTTELEAADAHRAAIATTMTLRSQVLTSAAADLAALTKRQDAAIAAGTMVRLADGTTAAMPDLGTPIKGNGWMMTAPVRGWIAQALTTLYANGYPRSDDDAMNLATIIYNESGGDPGVQNDWDSNAAMGMPSFGLMQTIGPTFEAFALPGHTKTGDPVHQIMAGARYAQEVYGGLAKVPGVKSLSNGGSYLPY